MHNKIIGPFFFIETTVTGCVYLDMLQNFALPQLEELQPIVYFQQDGAPPHWLTAVREHLNETFPNRWIGRGGPIPWPPRSPDITPLDFFLW
ncbi:transposable element tc3 transposase, partial [Lasius niger]